MNIETVKIQGNGYLVNGNIYVPKTDDNKDYKLIKEWLEIDGNEVEAEFTDFEQLENNKNNKIQEIKTACTADAPVTLDVDFINGTTETITFNGGDASASAIAGAVTLAQNLGETSVSLWDIDNVVHNNIAFSEAMVISAFIAKKWRDDMFKRQDLLTQINNATTIEELGSIKWI